MYEYLVPGIDDLLRVVLLDPWCSFSVATSKINSSSNRLISVLPFTSSLPPSLLSLRDPACRCCVRLLCVWACFSLVLKVRDEIVVRRRRSKSDSVSDDEAEVGSVDIQQ